MVRMFADEKASVEIPGIERNFSNIQNEYHVYAIMTYNHWIGSGFMTMDEDTFMKEVNGNELEPRAVPILLLCSCMLVLGGCNKEDKNKADNDKSSEETKAINEGEYSALLPFSVSDAGQKHAQMQTNLSDTLTIGTADGAFQGIFLQ